MKPSGGRLAAVRLRIDSVDRRIVRLLAERQRLVAAAKPFKPRLRDRAREERLLRLVAGQARRLGADRTFVREVYEALLGASRSFLRRTCPGRFLKMR
jgi:chorismate mutase